MKIKQLELFRYKRMLLNNIERIVYTPASVYQIILGTNGSGKSSLLFELSPLPANGSNYSNGGYKIMELESGGNEYKLISKFKGSAKHTFIKNGEKIAEDVNTSVQKELVKKEFGINQDIHELLIGEVKFTGLSPAKRREWITKLSDVDFTYALGVFQKLKSAARDAQGALKHVHGRITTETNKLLSVGDLEGIEAEYKKLHELLNTLLREKDNNDYKDPEVLENEITYYLEQIHKLSSSLITSNPMDNGNFDFVSLEDLEQNLSKMKTQREVLLSQRNNLSEEISGLNEIIKDFDNVDLDDLDKLKGELIVLKQQVYELNRSINTWRELKADPDEALESIRGCSDRLISVLSTLPPNPDRKFNKKLLDSTRLELDNLKPTLEKNRNRKAYAESQIEHLLSLKDQECPKCGHRWVPGRSDNELDKFKKDVEILTGNVTTLENKKEELSNQLELLEEYSSKFYSLRQLTHTNPALSEFWEHVLSTNELMEDPKSLIPQISLFIHDLGIHSKIKGHKERVNKLEKLFDSNSGNNQVQHIQVRLKSLEEKLESSLALIDEVDENTDGLESHKKSILNYLSKFEVLEKSLTDLQELRETFVKSLRDKSISKLISDHQIRLADVQAKRAEKLTLEGIIKDLKEDEVTLKDDYFLLSSLANELSPVDGLIAEQLLGFIEAFVMHMNQIIESVWTHELKVKPCAKESGDLDYKFPLTVKNNGELNLVPDISKGSEAQVEIVDFAFRIVAMVYLGLEQYPIYLDEFSRSFDEQHRINAMSFIKQLIDQGNYTQLFLVSHYASQFGVFNQAETLVLDSTNITVPQKHNEHVVIE
ncbi:MAG: hypothetical protein IBX57_00930 [Gammaproteobacteria bacterium]|nr:hypothetical protein [Gammaproteobacteria bacterium]